MHLPLPRRWPPYVAGPLRKLTNMAPLELAPRPEPVNLSFNLKFNELLNIFCDLFQFLLMKIYIHSDFDEKF